MTASNLATGQRLGLLRPISPSPRSEQEQPPSEPLRESPLLPLAPVAASSSRVVSFDLESIAAGYSDPAWVPSIITAWAFSWVGEDHVEVAALPAKHLYNKTYRRRFLLPLLAALEECDIATGHNIERHDLPQLNAETRYVGLPNMQPVMAQDTIRFPKTKGFKKGLDNLGVLLEVETPKLAMNHATWMNAYGDPEMAGIKARVVSDVIMHKEIRERMRERGWLKAPRMWSP